MEQSTIERPPAHGGAVASMAAASETDEVAGYLKWYDAAKGFGFIVPADGGTDILIGKAVIAVANFGMPAEGQKVVVLAQTRIKGRSATALLGMEPMPAPPPKPAPVPEVTGIVGPKRGTVKLFNDVRGFGFVTVDDGAPDIFVHVTILQQAGRQAMAKGESVEVVWGNGPKGLTAVRIAFVEASAEAAVEACAAA